MELVNDDRIEYLETPVRMNNWGHQHRRDYLNTVESEFVLITNSDNYLVPTFLEYMLRPLKNGYIASYCSQMVHSYKAWQVIECSMKRGYVDCSGVLIKTEAAKKVGWNNITDHSADWLFFEDLIRRFGINSFVKVNGCLLIHN